MSDLLSVFVIPIIIIIIIIMAEPYQLLSNPILAIGCHAWNGNRTQVAVSPNNHLVQIYEFKAGNFTLLYTLAEHSQRVVGLDWGAKTNRIVSSGEDRNAYVWVFEEASKEWKPTLVILRMSRAATCVKWSPSEDKFAVGSSSKLVSVCYFDKDQDFWVAKQIKTPIRSTVLCVDWHPNGVILATGSSDFKARVFMAAIKGVDKKPGETCWGASTSFGDLLAEFGTGAAGGGWVHAVSFNAAGDKLAFAAHDASITVVDGANGKSVARVVTRDLPYRCVTWITPKSFVAAGFDYVPVLYEFAGAGLVSKGRLDVPEKKAGKAMTAMDKFKTLDRKGTVDSALTETSLESTHQNAISCLSVFKGTKEAAEQLCSTGVDGKLVIWTLAKAAASAGVAIA